MKKKILVGVLLLVMTLAGCSNSSGNSRADMSDYDLLTVKEHHFVNENYDKLLENVTNKVPGIYYFGFADCPWCRELVPVLEEALNDTGTTAYYINVRSNDWSLERSQKFDAFNTSLGDDLKTTGFPFVVFIAKDGTISTHIGTLPSHNAYDREMNDNERTYLKRILKEVIEKGQ